MPERFTPQNEVANFIAHATASNDEQVINEPDDVSATNEVTANNHERDQEFAHLQQLFTSGVSSKKIIDSLSEFTHLSHQEIANKLIEAGEGKAVAYDLYKFTGLNQEIAIKLIEIGEDKIVVRCLDKFINVKYQEIANKLIKKGLGGAVAANLNKFTNLNQEIAEKLIEMGKGGDVAKYLDRFTNLNQEIAEKLIEAGTGWYVARYLNSFTGLNHQEIANKLIKKDLGGAVAANLDKFTKLDHQEIAEKLIEMGKGEAVAANLDKFTKLDHQEIAEKLIEMGKGEYVADNLYKFTGLNQEIVNKLIEMGKDEDVADSLNKFTGLNHQEIANKIIEMGEGETVVHYLNRFTGLNHQEIITKLIEAEQGAYAVDNLDKFTGLDHQEIAEKLFLANEGALLMSNLAKFPHLSWSAVYDHIFQQQNGDVSSLDFLFTSDVLQDTNLESVTPIRAELLAKLPPAVANSHFSYFSEKSIVASYLQNNPIYQGNDQFLKEPLEENRLAAENVSFSAEAEKLTLQESDYQTIFTLFKEKLNHWSDEENISGPFSRGAETFSYQTMFSYIAGREEVSYHDKLYGFDKIVSLQQLSKLSPAEFAQRILAQVQKDNSLDENDNSSYLRLNNIAESSLFTPNTLSQIKMQVDKLTQAGFSSEMAKITSMLEQESYFASWKNLTTFRELSRQLEKAQTWEKLAVLKAQALENPAKASLYQYVQTLMFHQDSHINLQAAEQMFLSPKKFLSREDAHSGNAHESKKPSNYLDIPNLDLTAEQLILSLTAGEIDKIQAFPAMQIIYSSEPPVTLNSSSNETNGSSIDGLPATLSPNHPSNYSLSQLQELPLREQLQIQLGSRKEQTGNKALFGKLQPLLKQAGLKLNTLLESDSPEAVLPADLLTQVTTLMSEYPNPLLKDYQEGIDKTTTAPATSPLSANEVNSISAKPKQSKNQGSLARIYKAQVHLKSDPKAMLAGSDTNCCMSFGSGKNNIYNFNPNCAIFTVQESKADGSYRTIAQSVLTLDLDIKTPVNSLVDSLGSYRDGDSSTSIHQLLPDFNPGESEHYLSCDNIEFASRAQSSEQVRQTVVDIYQDFFREYTKHFNEHNFTNKHISEDKVIVGQGFSDYRFGQSESNTFLPAAPVAYSDKYGSSVDTISLKIKDINPTESANSTNSTQEKPTTTTKAHQKNLYQLEKLVAEKPQLSPTPLPKYLSDLTYQDAVNITYLESQIYADNQNLKSEMSGLENSLIAKDINQVSKDRPNLSLKYHTPSGKIAGYLLAYEGVIDKDEYQSSDTANKQCIYIEDFATLPGQQLAAGRLLRGFLSLYQQHYLAKQNYLPLYFQAREKTSFRLVQRQLQHLGESLGVEFSSHELDTYQQGSDTMHVLLVEAKPKEQGDWAGDRNEEVEQFASSQQPPAVPIGELIGKAG